MLPALPGVSVRVAPITNRAADLAPVAPACCNVCRTCTTTNIIGLAIAGISGLGAVTVGVLRRSVKSS